MIKIAICDDQSELTVQLSSLLKKFSFEIGETLDVQSFSSAEIFLKAIKDKMDFNIILLDIEFPSSNGILVGTYIREKLKNEIVKIIYISAKTDYAMQLFKTRPHDFLVKPIDRLQLKETLLLAIELTRNLEKFFEFKYDDTLIVLKAKEIIYIESERRAAAVYTADTEYHVSLNIDIIRKNTCFNDFLHPHKSYLINREYIKEYRYKSILLTTGQVLPISQSNRKELREFFMYSVRK